MKCPEVSIWEDYLNGELDMSVRKDLIFHVQGCSECQMVLTREQRLDQLLRSQSLLKAPANFRQRVMQALELEPSPVTSSDWLWMLGLGLVILSVAGIVAGLGLKYQEQIAHKISWAGLNSAFQALLGGLHLQNTYHWVQQVIGSSTLLPVNLVLAGVILSWGLWQMVVALRR